jgi:hypothetical protein
MADGLPPARFQICSVPGEKRNRDCELLPLHHHPPPSPPPDPTKGRALASALALALALALASVIGCRRGCIPIKSMRCPLAYHLPGLLLQCLGSLVCIILGPRPRPSDYSGTEVEVTQADDATGINGQVLVDALLFVGAVIRVGHGETMASYARGGSGERATVRLKTRCQGWSGICR